VLVGGPEASQKGFGERTPQKFTLKSGMRDSLLARHKRRVDAASSAFSLRDGVHNLSAAVHAIATGIVFRVRSLHSFGIHNDASAVELQSGNAFQEVDFLFLAERFDHHLDF
jgi:hypothetical protein